MAHITEDYAWLGYSITLRFFFKFVSRANCSNIYIDQLVPQKTKM